jgi:ElaB/YqjD/DUF883 family membrane-anchored ribosome-binding protein
METTTKNTTSNPRSSEHTERSAKSAQADMRESWQEASSALSTLYEHAASELQTRVRERPYAALAAAAGVGFVLGGGLRSITGRMLLRTTAQLVVPEILASLRGADE